MFSIFDKCTEKVDDSLYTSTANTAESVGRRIVRVCKDGEFKNLKINKVHSSEYIQLVRSFLNYSKPVCDGSLEDEKKLFGWILFENGTFLILPGFHPEFKELLATMEAQKEWAITTLQNIGPVYLGVDQGDFGVSKVLEETHGVKGWIVVSCFDYLATCVAHNEIQSPSNGEPLDITQIGYFGREKRDLDASVPIIIHHEIIPQEFNNSATHVNPEMEEVTLVANNARKD